MASATDHPAALVLCSARTKRSPVAEKTWQRHHQTDCRGQHILTVQRARLPAYSDQTPSGIPGRKPCCAHSDSLMHILCSETRSSVSQFGFEPTTQSKMTYFQPPKYMSHHIWLIVVLFGFGFWREGVEIGSHYVSWLASDSQDPLTSTSQVPKCWD